MEYDAWSDGEGVDVEEKARRGRDRCEELAVGAKGEVFEYPAAVLKDSHYGCS